MTRLFANPFLRVGALITLAVGAVIIFFPGIKDGLLRADQFMPHATCYLRNPQIILLHVSSDLLIGIAYLSISLTLSYLVYKASKDIPFHWMFLAFGLFIITCGFTHFMEVWTVWQAVYWLAGYVKLICAAASVVTAVALIPLVPRIFAMINAVKVSEQRRLSLEAANADLETFAYSVSHDLRAPLRAVQGMASAMQEDYRNKLDQEGLEYLGRIADAGKRMDVLIQDILTYSRVGRKDSATETVDSATALADALANLSADIEQSGAEVKTAGEFLAVRASHTLLVQVLTNLLTNAVKFVHRGNKPVVLVSAETVGNCLRITVKDNGIGIPQEYREKIFRIFERLHSSSEYPGTGLGLAIVQKAVTQMKGRLGLDSTEGQGSSFWVELPLAGA